MGRLINLLVCVCFLSTCMVGASAEPNPSALALPMLLTTVGQTQVIVHDIQPTGQRLVLEIRSPDVTTMPSRTALRLAFDAEITAITKPNAPMPLQLETAITGQHVVFFFARDPFAFPQPWSYTVTLTLNELPQSGTVTWGNLPPQNVTYPAPVPESPVLPGT